MSVNVYAWPPVSLHGWMWTLLDPIEQSRSLITGADYLSAAQRRRRIAKLDVAALGKNRMGAGYVESLIELLKGGQHCVRLYSCRINPRGGLASNLLQLTRLEWETEGAELDWAAGGAEMLWDTGTRLTCTTGTDAAGWPIITVTGVPANALVAKPSEFVTLFADDGDAVGMTYRVLAPAYSNAAGVAVVRLHDAPSPMTDVRVNLQSRDTGVFRPVSIPQSMQPGIADWTYSWEFREVFEDEVGDGGFVEVNPWR
ncbi:hypothetical protein PVT71_18270 [Salipiger sp. H15]|uniref:Uncharacterized protein n=1 Tax=Alloyangia sp. H15 TaxID=3029062 RepID=A0AAU8ANM2_9RHOB